MFMLCSSHQLCRELVLRAGWEETHLSHDRHQVTCLVALIQVTLAVWSLQDVHGWLWVFRDKTMFRIAAEQAHVC